MHKEYIGEVMEYGYEEKYDVFGIKIFEDYEYEVSIEARPGFIVDVDKDKRIVAIEIVDISRELGVPKNLVRTARVDPKIQCKGECCRITLDFYLATNKTKQIVQSLIIEE